MLAGLRSRWLASGTAPLSFRSRSASLPLALRTGHGFFAKRMARHWYNSLFRDEIEEEGP